MRGSRLLATVLAACVLGALGATAASATPTQAPETNLAPIKAYLLRHTAKLEGFTARFETVADRYYRLAAAAGFDYAKLWRTQLAQLVPLLDRAKAVWIEGNPLYERVEGVVAGTPSLAVYDVIIDAGSSAKDDPASAVPFDLQLPDGRVLHKPGNLYNLTEGMLWGTRPELVAKGVRADLN